jgi:basic membrane protein A
LILASSPAAEPFPLAIPVLSDFEQPSASAGLPSEATDTEMDAETSPGALVPEQIDEAISDSTVDDKIPDISPKPVALQGPAPQKRARLPAWVWFAAAAVLILLVVGLYWVFVGGRNGDQHPSQLQGGTLIVGGECRSEDVLCVGLVTGVGEIDDKSFNQSAWEGVQQTASELGAQVAFIETKDALDFAENIAQFGDEGYDVIVTVGFEMTEATAKAAQEYPDTNFVGVDQFHPESIDNLATLIFDESKAGFLAGALAAILTESNTVAAVLGTDLVPQIKAFKEGFESGAMYVSPDINLILTYHPGAVDAAFTDPEWGANTARQALDQGADVIFAAAGQTGNSALIETAAAKGALCIGAATDQWQTFPEARPCLVSSAMKLVTPGVFDMIKMSTEGEFPTGQFAGEVSLAPFRNLSDIVAQDVSAKIAEIEARIQDGTIRID